jgi:DNA invertase Pin-like site-specific DNA recombinase
MATSAIAYLRTSSAANVGGDSDKRQRDAIARYAKSAGIEIAAEFYYDCVTNPTETQHMR